MSPKKIASVPPATEAQPRSPMPGVVLVQKRVASQAPSLREKLCATCGKPFQLEPEQKFFICPDCYRKAQPPAKKSPRRGEAQVLIQIRCMECGTVEYLDFVPPDPAAVYCRACFAKHRREPRPNGTHEE